MKGIDINCDVGEGIGNESELFPFISSCNIACGAHAGDEATIREIALLANKHNLKIGAHPSYPDRKNFGRIVLDLPKKELIQSIQQQLNTFLEVLDSESISLHHIKAHGALYNEIAQNKQVAETFLEAILKFKSTAILYVPYQSVISKLAEQQAFTIKYEAFCDRNYNDDLTLVSRKKEYAIIKKPIKVLEHLLPMVKNNMVKTLSGKS